MRDAEPLSLDDDPPPAPRRSAIRPVRVAAVVAVMAATFALAYAAARRGSGWVPEVGWVAFAAPDGSCRAELPTAAADDGAFPPIPDFPMTRAGRRFVARAWYSKATASVGWVEVDAGRAKTLRLEDLAGGETARRRAELGATAVASASATRGGRDGVEVRYRTPNGPVVDRMLFAADGPRPRLYVLTFAAPALPADAAAVGRFFDSFRVNE